MTRGSASLVREKVQIKPWQDTTMGLLEWIEFKRLTIPSAERMQSKQDSYPAGGKAKRYSHSLWKTAWHFFIKLNIHFQYGLAIPCLSIYLREMKTCAYTETTTQIFIGAYCIISKNW